jgi:hypothetical protein
MMNAKRGESRAPGLALLAVCLSFAVLAVAPTAWAQSASFNTTNVLSGSGYGNAATPIAGYPTNSVGTNGLGQGTGSAIALPNCDQALFWFTAYCATNTGGGTPSTNNVTIILTRAATGGVPGATYGTNVLGLGTGTTVTNLQATDWETYSNVAPITLTIPLYSSTAGAIRWQTNLTPVMLGMASHVGVGQLQLNATNAFLTNVACGLNWKIIPLRYP